MTCQSPINNQQSSIPLAALFAALIFIAHPIQTQAVTYTTQRYASLAALFFMASVLFYLKGRILCRMSDVGGRRTEVGGQGSEVRGRRSEGRGAFSLQPSAFYVLCIISGILAFMSKQNTASLPAVILLVEYLCIDSSWAGWKKKLPWIGLAFVLCLTAVLYVSGAFGVVGRGGSLLEDVSDFTRDSRVISRWSYLCTQFNVVVVYIRLLFFPVGQNVDDMYPFRTGFFDGVTPLAFLFLTGLVLLAVWRRKKTPVITLAIFWFFITLSVESSIIPIRDALFEHRLYLPMFGFALAVSYALFYLFSRRELWGVITSLGIIIVLGTATYQRNRVWQDYVSLWTDVVEKSPHNFRAHTNLGIGLYNEHKTKKAISHFLQAIRLRSNNDLAHYNLGLAFEEQGALKPAVAHYREALRIKPGYVKAHVNL
ncbi:MAG: tetratricopeptide repeat protein, partial [Deltaproteobacteria bacterium]|nr:tetratricopeptide repeat protein [Deltaproteobacteria bacterium]